MEISAGLVDEIGLAPATLFAIAALKGSRRLAWWSLGVGAVLYLGWGLLNDAAVHGWQDLKVFSV